MTLHSHTIYDAAAKNALAYGSAPCLVSHSGSLSFSAYLRRVDSAAAVLFGLGLLPGDRVALVSGNSAEFLVALTAVSRLNAIAVAVNWRLSAEELSHVLSDTRPKLILSDPPRMAALSGIISRSDFSCSLVGLDTVAGANTCSDPSGLPARGNGDDPFLIIHTAAVSGKPRGAVLSHHNLVLACLQAAAFFRLGQKDCCLALLPFFHILQLVLSYAVMAAGGKNVVQDHFDPDECVRKIGEHGVSLMGSFPPILFELTRAAEKAREKPVGLRAVAGIDAAINIEPFQKAFGADFHVLYGQTETSGPITICPSNERPGSAGKPAFLSMVKVKDECGGNVTPENPGEICVRGPLVFQGYWDRGKIARPTFADGWHMTGDLGWMDPEGFLFFAGRKPERELIKPGGENVFPAEVESVLKSHADVMEAVVIGVQDARFGEAVKAVCVKKKGSALSEAGLIEFVASRIARYKKPREVMFVESLPLDATGKVCRKTVKEQYGT